MLIIHVHFRGEKGGGKVFTLRPGRTTGCKKDKWTFFSDAGLLIGAEGVQETDKSHSQGKRRKGGDAE